MPCVPKRPCRHIIQQAPRRRRDKILSQRPAKITWAAKDLPARLLAANVAKLLNCTPEDVAVLVTAGKLRPLERPNTNAGEVFLSTVKLIALLVERKWLDEGIKTIGQFWKRKNARHKGLMTETPSNMTNTINRGVGDKNRLKPFKINVKLPCKSGYEAGNHLRHCPIPTLASS
jgi:hypothetical protein